MDDPLSLAQKSNFFKSNMSKKQLIQQLISEKFLKLQHQIKTQKKLITDLRDETIALRENNIKLQVENFKLQRRLNEIENAKSNNLSADSFSHNYNQSLSYSWHSLNDEQESETEDFLEDIFRHFEEVDEEETLETLDHEESFENEGKNFLEISETSVHEDSFENEDKNLLEIPEEPEVDVEEEKQKRIFLTVPVNSQKKAEPKRITVSKSKKNLIDAVQSGQKYDAVFVAKCLEAFFDTETLMKSTVSGMKCKNSNYTQKGYEKLNPNKVSLIKKMLSERIKKENVSQKELEARIKKLNMYVNTKIQNVRRNHNKKTERSMRGLVAE